MTVADYRDGQGTGKTAQAVTEHVVGSRMPGPPLTVVPLVSGLTFPIDLAFTHDQNMLFVERPGKLSVRLSDGTIPDGHHEPDFTWIRGDRPPSSVRIQPPVLYL